MLTASAVVLIAAGSALATTVQVGNSTVGTTGGPFVATVVSGSIGNYGVNATFPTFCLERSEFFTPGAVYTAVISDRAVSGNAGGADDPSLPWYGQSGYINTSDMLDPKTAFLYTHFIQGTMASVVNAWTGVNGDKIALQDAIWNLEGENVATGGATAGMASSLMNAANAAGWSTIGNVRVMQLWNTSVGAIGTQAAAIQEHLVIIPLPPAILAGMGLLSMIMAGQLRRRSREGKTL
jgi:hypothetical protein